MRILPDRIRNAIRRRFDVQSIALVRNSSWFFVANANGALCDFLRSVVVARGLGAESFGIFVLVTTLVRTIQEFCNLNVGSALVKFGAEYRAEDQTQSLAALLKGLILLSGVTALASIGVVSIVSAISYSTFFSTPGLEPYLQLYAIAASLSFFDSVSISLLNLHFRFRLNSVIKVVLDLAELAILGVAVWLYPGDLQALLWASVGALLVKGAVYNGAALWEMRDLIVPNLGVGVGVIRSDGRRIGAFLVNNSLSRTVHSLIFSGDVLLLGALTGPREVGYYSIAKKLAFAVLRLTDPLQSAIFPQLATLVAKRDLASVSLMVRRISGMLGVLMAGLFLIGATSSTWLMTMIYGPEFSEAGTAFAILMAAAGTGAALFWSTSLIVSLGRVDARLKAYLAALAVSALIAWLCIPHLGATGLALGMLAAVVTMQALLVTVCMTELRR